MISTVRVSSCCFGALVTKAHFVTPQGLLHSGAGTLARLGRQATQLTDATRLLRQHLASPLADHATVAAIRGPTLVVVVDSPAWAARLRYQSAEILEHLAAALGSPSISRLKVLVRAVPGDENTGRRMLRRRPTPPPQWLIRQVSETLGSGPLRERLTRLAVFDPQPSGGLRGTAPREETSAGEAD